MVGVGRHRVPLDLDGVEGDGRVLVREGLGLEVCDCHLDAVFSCAVHAKGLMVELCL